MASTPPKTEPLSRGARLEPDERRRQLLAAARELFSERHYGAVSLEEIAKKAGVARGLINHYFGTKRDLYVEVVREMVYIPSPNNRKGGATGANSRSRIAKAVDDWLEMTERNRETWLNSVRSQGLGDPEIDSIFEQARETAAIRMLEMLGFEGEEATPVRIAMLRAYGGLAEAATVQWLEHGRFSREQVHELLTESATRTAHGLFELVEQQPGTGEHAAVPALPDPSPGES